MGYMTTITIRNDNWSKIKQNPEQLIRTIEKGMVGINYNNSGANVNIINMYPNYIQIAKSNHADDFRLYLIGKNDMNVIGNNNIQDIEKRKELLKIAKRILKNEEDSIKELECKLKEV